MLLAKSHFFFHFIFKNHFNFFRRIIIPLFKNLQLTALDLRFTIKILYNEIVDKNRMTRRMKKKKKNV